LCVSSPKVAAPSKPPNDRMQKTIAKPKPDHPLKSADGRKLAAAVSIPGRTCTRIAAHSTRIPATATASKPSISRPARRMSQRCPNGIAGKLGYYAMAGETSISAGTWEAARAAADVALTSLAPAFMLSELKRAFEIGFLLFVPFLIIDMAVASILMSMGMMMLPPVIISLPFKLIFFVLVDGWRLVAGSLVQGYAHAGPH